MKPILLSSLFLFFSLHLFAAEKGVISGKVVEQIGGLPVPAAVIAVYAAGADQPIITAPTDQDGAFKIGTLKYGTYKVKVSYIGFIPLVVEQIVLTDKDPEKRLGILKLVADQTSLNEVTITTEKPLIQYAADMMTYNVEQSMLAEGSTASDILRNVPMVEVDLDGNASISGKRNTRIFIDSKPSDYMTSNIADLLSVLPSDAIEKIEVMTNPPARYSGDGEGIINIVLKKNFKIGLGGNAGGTVGLTGKTNVNANTSYKSKNYSINGGGAYQYNLRRTTNTSFRENFLTDTTFYQNNLNDFRDAGDGGNYRANFDWNISKKQNLRVSTSYNNNSSNSIGGGYNHSLDEDQVERSLRTTVNTGKIKSATFVADADYDLNLDTAGGRLTLGLTYNDNYHNTDRIIDRTFMPANRTQQLQNNVDNVGNNGLTFRADFDKPIFKKRDNIELGVQYTFRNNSKDQRNQFFDFNTQQYVINEKSSNQFLYDEDIVAGYASYNFRTKNWGAKAGLRAELTAVHFDLSSGENYDIEPYISLFPSASLSRNFKKFNLTSSYSVRVNRPRENTLNPQINNLDPLDIRFGNPNLDPELTHQMDVGLNAWGIRWNFNPRLTYSSRSAVIERFRSVDQAGVSETTFDNVAANEQYGIILAGNYRPTKTISTNANFMFSQTSYKSDLNSSLNRTGKNVSGRIGLSMQLPLKTAFEGNINYYNNISAQGRNKGSITTWMGARKVFMKNKLNARVSISDPFGRANNSSFNEGSNFRVQNYNTNNTSNVTLSLNYRFARVSKTKVPPASQVVKP
ncbi:MAG: TonB-dependent receptor [Pedobacter sp.]|nr:MAG: TonB-dependent receptor [Pedobacter sp.]